MNGWIITGWATLAAVALFALDRLALWMEARGWIYWRRRRAKGSAIGAAMLELQDMLEAGRARQVIEARDERHAEAPDPGAAPPGRENRRPH